MATQPVEIVDDEPIVAGLGVPRTSDHPGVREELGEPPDTKDIPTREWLGGSVAATAAVMLSELPNGVVTDAVNVNPNPVDPGAEMAGAGNIAANGVRMIAQLEKAMPIGKYMGCVNARVD